MFYLVFSLDENACEEVWRCFTKLNRAKMYLTEVFESMCLFYERDGAVVTSNINANRDYARIDISGSSANTITEFFLVEIPESKVLSTMVEEGF